MGYERKEYKGNAAPTALTGAIDADDTTVAITDATNWPTGGANGKFVIAIGRGTAFEEKMLCTARTGTSITVSSRGHDGTTPQSHAVGQAVEHVLDAETIDQVNRLANLLTTKGDVIAHNGVNPVRLGPGVSTVDDDGKVLQLKFSEATGLIFAALETFRLSASAPDPDGAVRLWYDQATGQLRPSDGASWLTPVQLPAFPSAVARDSYFTEVAGCACWRTDLNFAEVHNVSGWIPLGRPAFANAAARDAYYDAPWDGAQAYLLESHAEQVYRADAWVTFSYLHTVSASAPAGPLVGDLWLEPVG